MRAKTGITIACFCALPLFICAGAGLEAQTSPSPSQPVQAQPAAAQPEVLTPSVGASLMDSANDLSVGVGKTVLVDCKWPVARAAINLKEIAEIHATSPTEIMVQGKAAGETSLIIWDTHGGRQFYNVTVRPSTVALNDSLDAVRRELRTELPGEPLRVSYENGSILLRGTVKNLESSARAERIASAGISKDGKVVNLLDVNVPASEPQILLKVRFASINLSKESQMGINIFSNGFGNTIGGISTGTLSPTLPSGTTGASVSGGTGPTNLFAFVPGLNLGVTIQALQQNNIIDVLAEPNIMALNGKPASFLAGGEYPYPVPQASASGTTITIMFKEYGVRLNFIATVTPRGTIRLQVAPEVSSLDFAGGIEIDGFDVPAIDTQKMNTEVELADGQSFAISGLLDNRDNEAFSKIPFLGDIPILGKFFQSQTKTKTKTELLVFVTPEIVAPIPVGDPLQDLKYPGKFLPANTLAPLHNPDTKTAANTLPPAPPTISVDKLKDSLRPETPLVIEGASGGFGVGSSTMSTNSTSSTPASQ